MNAALVLGEALVDVVDGVAHPGGSPLNVAVGLARFGIPTTLHARLGEDDHGRMIERHLESSGVRLTPASRGPGSTSVAEAVVGADGSATYRFSIDGALDDPGVPLAAFSVVHAGSISAVLPPGADLIARVLTDARGHATISYDPNVRPQLMDGSGVRERIEVLIATADVVKASDEDLGWLYPGVAVTDVIADWLRAGPSIVAVTRGGEGSTVAARAGLVEVPAPPTSLSDTIGAGDSYMAALLTALSDEGLLGAQQREALASISRDALERAGRFAAACAAITVSRPGADPPTLAELSRS